MEYFIITLAVCCFSAQFAFTKVFESSTKQTNTTALVMLVLTSAIGALLYLFVGAFNVKFSLFSLIWAIAFAIIMIPYYLIGIKVLSLGSLAIYSMFMMLGGMLVPFFYGIIFLSEEASLGKILGCIALTVFIVLQAIWGPNQSLEQAQNQKSKKVKLLFFSLCIVIFFINGMTGVIAKAHQIGEGAVDEISFTVISCGLILLFSILTLAFQLSKGRAKEKLQEIKSTFKLKPLIAMIALGLTSYTGNFLHLITAVKVPASVQFPLVSGGVIVLSAIVSAFIFREKITKKEWLTVAGSFVSTFLFAF